jgi:hypothetical protein
MICSVCNKEVENGIKICPFCGAFLDEKEENVIEVSFKKPAPPPVIELSFVEPVPEAEIEPEIELEIEAEIEPEVEVVEEEPAAIEPLYVEPIFQEKPSKKTKKKSKDKLNFFYLLLSLLWAPYPGIFLWVATSKKTPKASQAYGIAAIVMYLLKCFKKFITPIIAQIVAVLVFLVCVIGITVVLFMIQFGYMPMPI